MKILEKMKEYMKVIRRFVKRRNLGIEYHLCEHCNLNCAGCDHFSPLAEKVFADLDSFTNDMRRLQILLNGSMRYIRLLGGEPLLNEKVGNFIDIARRYFPKAKIEIVTNGTLLDKMDKQFWKNCREKKVTILVTKYPINVAYDKMKNLACTENVEYKYTSFTDESHENIVKKMYRYPLDIEGRQNTRKSFAHCECANNYAFLKNGRIYACPICASIGHFNKYFGYNLAITEKDYIDIYETNNKHNIFRFLSKPIPFCRYCNVDKRKFGFEWEVSKKSVNEWT